MADDPTPPVPTSETPPPPPPKPAEGGDPPEGKTFTQAELDEKLAARASQAERAAKKSLTEQFGMSLAEVEALIKAKAEKDEADKDAVTKATEAAHKAEQEAIVAIESARKAGLESKLSLALVTKGDGDDAPLPCRPERVEAAMAIALPFALDSEEEDPVTAAIDHLRKILPDVFESEAGDKSPPRSPPGPSRKIGEQTSAPTGAKADARRNYEARRAGRSIPVADPTK